MNSRRIPHEALVRGGDLTRRASGAEDIPGAAAGADADDGNGPALYSSVDYVAAVAVERRIGEVRVAVDEPFKPLGFLGHLL